MRTTITIEHQDLRGLQDKLSDLVYRVEDARKWPEDYRLALTAYEHRSTAGHAVVRIEEDRA